MIPKKIHFTYASENLPETYQENLKKWKEMCPDWEFSFYSDEKIYQLFKEHFPDYYEELPKIPYGAMLADFFRYAVLFVHGGLYSDIDTIPLKKIPETWLNYEVVIGYEYQPSKFPESLRYPWNEKEFLCQWTLLSASGNLLFKEALELSFQRLRKRNYQANCIFDVLNTAGPLLLTDVASPHLTNPELLILDADYFGCREDEHFPFTDRSVIKHQCHGKNRWMIEVKMPHLNLGYR